MGSCEAAYRSLHYHAGRGPCLDGPPPSRASGRGRLEPHLQGASKDQRFSHSALNLVKGHALQACKLKFRLRDLTSCLCSAAAPGFCFKGREAGVDTIETGNEFSQHKF